jgi:hypothetical protein
MRKSVLVVMTVLTLMKMLWSSVMMMMMMMMKIVISAEDPCLQLKEVVGAVLLRHPTEAVEVARVGVEGNVVVSMRM